MGRPIKNIKQANGIVGGAPRNTTNSMKQTGNNPKAIKNAIGIQPGSAGYRKIKGAVSG